VLEAMAMGRPVVASRAAVLGIDAVDGRDLITTDEPADAVIGLLQNPLGAAAIGASARERMVESYSWDAQLAPLRRIISG
jgi:glycosyltransferase involved in cell wall biosynthesis